MILKMPLRYALGNLVFLCTLGRIEQSSECARVRTSTNDTCSKTMGKICLKERIFAFTGTCAHKKPA